MSDKLAFDLLGRRLVKSSFLLPIFLFTVALFIISSFLMVEDYFTTKWGYEMLSTRTGFPITTWFVAALPQVVQGLMVYFTFGFALDGREETQRWAKISALVWLAMFSVDVYTDTVYRVVHVENPISWVEGIAQSIFIFTIGSEIAWTVSFGFLKVISKEGLQETGGLIKNTAIVVGKLLGETIVLLGSAVGFLLSLIWGTKNNNQTPRQDPNRPTRSIQKPKQDFNRPTHSIQNPDPDRFRVRED